MTCSSSPRTHFSSSSGLSFLAHVTGVFAHDVVVIAQLVELDAEVVGSKAQLVELDAEVVGSKVHLVKLDAHDVGVFAEVLCLQAKVMGRSRRGPVLLRP